MVIGPDPPPSFFPGGSRKEDPTTMKISQVAKAVLADIVTVSPALDPKRVEAEGSFRSAYEFEELEDCFKFIQTKSLEEIIVRKICYIIALLSGKSSPFLQSLIFHAKEYRRLMPCFL